MSDKIDEEKEEKQRKAAELRRAFIQDDFSEDYNRNATMSDYFGVERPAGDVAHDAIQAAVFNGLLDWASGGVTDIGKGIFNAKVAAGLLKSTNTFNRAIKKFYEIGKPVSAWAAKHPYYTTKAAKRVGKQAAKEIGLGVGKLGGAAIAPFTSSIIRKLNKNYDYSHTDWNTLDDFFDYVDANKDKLPEARLNDFMNAYTDYIMAEKKSEKIRTAKYLGELIQGTRLAENYLGRDYQNYENLDEE